MRKKIKGELTMSEDWHKDYNKEIAELEATLKCPKCGNSVLHTNCSGYPFHCFECNTSFEYKNGKYAYKFECVNWLEELLEERKIDINELSETSGIELSIIKRIIAYNIPFELIYISTINAIAQGLDMSIHQFIDEYFDRFMEVK